MRRASLVLLAAACGGIGAAGDASAAKRLPLDPGLVHVVTPRDGAAPLGATMRVSLRLARGARLVTAEVGGRSIRRYLRRRPSGRLAGRVPRRVLGFGARDLRLVARSASGRRRDVDLVELLAARRRPGLLTTRVRRIGRGAGGVELRVRLNPHRGELHASLNGRRIGRALLSTGPGERTARLSAADGLRHGRNRIVVKAHDRRRFADTAVHVVRIRRRAPLPGVRAARVAPPRSTVAFDGSASRAAHPGSRLGFRWRIVRKPRGSRVRLRGKGRRVARIVPDRPGRYRLRLTVSERRRGRARSSAVGSSSVSADVETPCQVAPAYGLPISTSPGTPSVTIAGETYEGPTQPGALQLLVIDRLTGCVDNASIPAGGPGQRDAATLADIILTAGGPLEGGGDLEQLVVLTGATAQPNGAQLGNQETMAAVEGALQELGWDPDELTQAAGSIADGDQFTLIGVLGQDPGQAFANFDAEAGMAGGLSGVLRPSTVSGSEGMLKFESDDFVPFDVGAPGQPGTIGSGDDAVAIPDPGAGEVGITVLDAHTLALVGSATTAPVPASVNSAGPGGANPAQLLHSFANDSTKLFVVRMRGRTADAGDRMPLAQFTQDLATIGVNRDLFVRSFAAPDPNDSHAFVWRGTDYTFIGGSGVAGVDGSTLKQVFTNTGTTAVSGPRLQGFLTRDEHGRLQAQSATQSTSGPLDTTLGVLASAPPTQFQYPPPQGGLSPPIANAHYAEAEARLFNLIVQGRALCNPDDSSNCDPIQPVIIGNYGNPAFTDHLDGSDGNPGILDALHCSEVPNLPDGFYPGGVEYTSGELQALWVEVCGQMDQIDTIADNLFEPLSDVLANQLSDSTLDLLSESETLKGFIDEQKPVQKPNALSLLSDSLYAVSDLIDAFGPEDEEISGPLSIMADALAIASDATASEPFDARGGHVETTTGTLASWVASQFSLTSETLGEIQAIINTDPEKLAQTAAKAQNDGLWDLTDQKDQMTELGRATAASYMWPQLLTAGFDQPSCKPNGGSYSPTWQGPHNSDPLTYVAAINVGLFVGDQDQPLAFPFFFSVPSVELSQSDAQQIASSAFHEFDPTLSPTPGGVAQTDFAMRLSYPQTNLCQAPIDWIANSP
jgi:hypothetical protein